MAASSDIPSVGEYLRRTSRLLDDIDNAIHDLSFQLEGGNVVWAADFTEVQAFALPDDVEQRRSSTDAALDLATLERFFFGTEDGKTPSIVLLPPHRVELRNAEGFFQQRAILDFQEMTRSAAAEVRLLQLDTRFGELLTALNRRISKEKRERLNGELLGYLNKHAGALFLTITQSHRTPQGRLRELLQRTHLVDLSSEVVFGRTVAPSELDDNMVRDLTTAIYSRRVDRAAARRRVPTQETLDHLYRNSLRDAVAVAYLSFVNDRMDRRRLLLLTRSEIVISEVKRYAETLGNPRLRHFLRRATAFRQSLVSQKATIAQRIDDLRQRRRGLVLAGNALRQPVEEALGTAVEERRANIEQQIARLNELWVEWANLSVATLPWTPPEASPISNESIPDLLDILRNKDRLNEIVRSAATRLAADINVNNALLGYFDTSEVGSHRVESFVEIPSLKKPGRPVLVWSKDTLTTIALYFYDDIVVGAGSEKQDGSRVLRRLLNARLQLDNEDSGEDRATVRQPRLVESCLASSFLEAIEERWNNALTFADMAVNWPDHLDRTPRHEAFYMRAVARRRDEGPRLESLEKCIADLLAAAANLEKTTGSKTEDPRYLLQRGICHFGIWEHVEGGKMRDVNAPTITASQPMNDKNYSRATTLFEKAKNLIDARGQNSDSSKRLLLDVANARCYSYVSAFGGDDTALRLYAELTRAIRECGWDNETVPISQLDTLVWTMFLLRDRLEHRDALVDAATALARRLPTFNREEQDKAVVAGHLRQIGMALGLPLLQEEATYSGRGRRGRPRSN